MNSAHWPGVINNGYTTGKSIEIYRRSWAQGLLEVSALSVVVKLNGELGNSFAVKIPDK
jgi:hypothetical protein